VPVLFLSQVVRRAPGSTEETPANQILTALCDKMPKVALSLYPERLGNLRLRFGKMKNRNSRLLAAAFLASGVTMASAAEKWDLPTGYPATNFHTLNIQEFGACLTEGTKGEINVAVHPNGVLFKAADIKRAVQTSQAIIGERLMSAHEKENALYGTDWIPFLATNYDASVKLYQSAKPELEKALEAQGLKLVYSVPWPPQGLYFKQEVKSMVDMKGIKIRSYNTATQRLSELTGMAPVQIEASETSQALAAGVIDALVTSAVTGSDVKAWENLKFYYGVGVAMPRNHVIINKAKYDGLSDDTKKAMADCASKAEVAGVEKSKAANEAALKTLVENGITIVEPSPQLKDELAAIGKTMADEWLARAGDPGKTVIEIYKK
jgi:TRAP-type C4-dicarboxylate transport system substrate-binding protein